VQKLQVKRVYTGRKGKEPGGQTKDKFAKNLRKQKKKRKGKEGERGKFPTGNQKKGRGG